MNDFLFNLSRVLAHTLLLEAKGEEPLGEAWATGLLSANLIGGALMESPDVPGFKPIDLKEEQRKAAEANVANFGIISNQANQANVFNQEQISKMMEMAGPGYAAMLAQLGKTSQDFMAGNMPASVSDAIGRSAAWQSMRGGYGGSGMARNLVARDLGLGDLDIINKGVSYANQWMQQARASTAMPYDYSKMFITTGDQAEATRRNREGQFQRDWMANQIDAEYSMGTIAGKAIIKTDDQMMSMASSVAGSAAGAAI